MRFYSDKLFFIAIVLLTSLTARAGPFAAPGDSGLRHDLQLLDDAGLINIPMTAWPLAWRDVAHAVDRIDSANVDEPSLAALQRVRARAARATGNSGAQAIVQLSAAVTPPDIRTFDNTPRDEAGLGLQFGGQARQFAFNAEASFAANPDDNDRSRLDGTYASVHLGNWLLAAGWQDRWWGPGQGGSLILSSNARPLPGVSLQRATSSPFQSRWLRWIGPWTLSAFLGRFEDQRVIDNALLLGLRGTFRPTPRLEIGLSRTAQLCGDGRKCDASTFVDTLLGRDNRGVNVSPEDEPGNQLAGIDVRWRLPGNGRIALYAQWIAEDTRRGGPELGSWLRMVGLERWGRIGGMQYRTFVEIADTACRSGGLGFSEAQADCGYEHSIYRSGYRHHGRSLGYGTDGDGLSYSAGSTLVQSAEHRWGIIARFAELNRIGSLSMTHSLSDGPARRYDVSVSHDRNAALGDFSFGLGFRYEKNTDGSGSTGEPMAYLSWRSRAFTSGMN